MIDKCDFCGQNKEISIHHRIAQKYNGTDEDTNKITLICIDCHKQLENGINQNRANAGAGNVVLPIQNFIIGSTNAQLITGSTYLDDSGRGFIDAGSPFYGMSCHTKKSGQKYIEASLSGGSIVLITGSPSNDWLIYSYSIN